MKMILFWLVILCAWSWSISARAFDARSDLPLERSEQDRGQKSDRYAESPDFFSRGEASTSVERLSPGMVRVTGSAVLQDGQYQQTRQRAYENALQQAVAQFGADGMGQAVVSQSVVEDEYVAQGVLNLKVNVEVETLPVCPESSSSHYRKKVAVLGFSLQTPSQAKIGALYDVERGVASYLSHAFDRLGGLVVLEQSQQALYGEPRNAPTGLSAQRTLSSAAGIARQMGVQFVVSGVVRDLSLVDESAFGTSVWSKLRRVSQQANLNRRFVVDVFVHDGFSGAIVWQRQYKVEAEWTEDIAEVVGFESPRFQAMPYGLAVTQKLDEVARSIDEQLRCQPFMTRISRVDGKTLHFSSGASSGIRPGDRFSLYRTEYFEHADQSSSVELSNVKSALVVTQVHPDFGSGSISIDPGRMNIQEDDVLVAW